MPMHSSKSSEVAVKAAEWLELLDGGRQADPVVGQEWHYSKPKHLHLSSPHPLNY